MSDGDYAAACARSAATYAAFPEEACPRCQRMCKADCGDPIEGYGFACHNPSCGTPFVWHTSNRWTEEERFTYFKHKWLSVHGTWSPAIEAWGRRQGPAPDCDCDYCKRQAAAK